MVFIAGGALSLLVAGWLTLSWEPVDADGWWRRHLFLTVLAWSALAMVVLFLLAGADGWAAVWTAACAGLGLMAGWARYRAHRQLAAEWGYE